MSVKRNSNPIVIDRNKHSEPFKTKIMKTQFFKKSLEVVYLLAAASLFHATIWIINYIVYNHQF